jgi:F0F1-type ATP synthase assembly protein I
MQLGDPRDLQRYFAYSQVGMEMVAPIVVGLLLDFWLHWLPWGVLTGSVLGLAGGLVHLIYLVNKENAESSPPPSNPREAR